MSDFDEVEAYVSAGKKIEAIKAFRALTGAGLKDSKDAVEWFEAHGEWPARPATMVVHGGSPSPSSPVGSPPKGNRRAEIEQLMAGNQKIGAIKILREITDWGLREAKNAVDHYQAHAAWQPEVLVALGEPATEQLSITPNSMTQVLTKHLGYAPDLQLCVRARRLARDGQLAMLRDCAFFVREDRGHAEIERVMAYDAIRQVELDPGEPAVLYLTVEHVHERFELGAADAEAALAILRVLGG